MIGTFKKIWEFSGEERGNINKSVAISFLNAVFHMFEIGAIYFVVMALTNGDKDMKTVWISLAFRDPIRIDVKFKCNKFN